MSLNNKSPHLYDRGDLVKHKDVSIYQHMGIGVVVSKLTDFLRAVEWTERIRQPDVDVYWSAVAKIICYDTRELVLVSKAESRKTNEED